MLNSEILIHVLHNHTLRAFRQGCQRGLPQYMPNTNHTVPTTYLPASISYNTRPKLYISCGIGNDAGHMNGRKKSLHELVHTGVA